MNGAAAVRPPKIPANMMAVQVVRRADVARDAVSFFLAIPGTQRSPGAYQPGQFVTLALPTASDVLYRSYSLCSTGAANELWEITIKRVQHGRVSNFLLDQVPVGAILYSSTPRGTFTLPAPLRTDVPLIFVAAGSGITPIQGMLRAIAKLPANRRPQVQLHYASRIPEEILYREELRRIDPTGTWLKQYHYLSSQGQTLAAATVLGLVGANVRRAHWYICGPDALRTELTNALTGAGVAAPFVHAEVFATQARTTGIVDSGRGPGYQMFIQENQAALTIGAGEAVLPALERQGYQPDFSCRVGTCGDCKLRLLAGRVEQNAAVALTPAEKSGGMILSCVAHPLGDITLLSGGRATARGRAVSPVAAISRVTARNLVRAACVTAVGTLVFGVWNLTDHRPASWDASAAAAPTTTTTGGGSTATPTDTATPDPNGGGNPAPTATATQTPIPQPTATTRPSH